MTYSYRRSCLWLLGLALAHGSVIAQEGPPPALVETAPAQSREVAATRWFPGTVVSRNDARIAAEVSGRATWVAEVGTALAAGGVIARVDERMLKLQLADNDASIKRLKAQQTYQQSQVQRLDQLADTNNAAANQLDEARSQLEVVAQDLVAAQVARQQIEYNIERSQVKAPFPGRVVERLVQPGEFLNPGTPVARLVDTGNKEIRVQAPVTAARYVSDGDLVSVKDDFVDQENPVRTVIPVGDERSRMIEIRVQASQPEWVIGSAVRVALPSSELRQLVAIPRDALVLRGSDTFVYRVSNESTAQRVDISTGIGLGNHVEVLGGIAAGDQLVVRGAERLRPDQPLKVVESLNSPS